ncbi:hypothetical protein MJT46_017922 [Ovis ammon polii x Ovis aries]|nr:hypothetical protein MJT46_017922 [Ovis ammon polii x Ovis aries]
MPFHHVTAGLLYKGNYLNRSLSAGSDSEQLANISVEELDARISSFHFFDPQPYTGSTAGEPEARAHDKDKAMGSWGKMQLVMITYILSMQVMYDNMGFWKGVKEKVISGGFPGGSVVKNPPANAGDTGLIPDPGGSHILSCHGAAKPMRRNY